MVQALAEVLGGLGHVEPAIGAEDDGGTVEVAGDEGKIQVPGTDSKSNGRSRWSQPTYRGTSTRTSQSLATRTDFRLLPNPRS